MPSRGLASLSRVHMDRAKTVWFLLHLHCHRSVVSLSALNVSHLIDNCPDVEIRPLLQFSHLLRAGPVLQTLLFFPLLPSFYRLLCRSIYSFPLVRYTCLLSAGVLHAFLCLRVYSYVSMERDVLHVHLLLHHLVPSNSMISYRTFLCLLVYMSLFIFS